MRSARALADGVDRLAALLRRLADQPHAAQLAGDEQAGHVGLELRRYLRDVDAALLGAEHERDRVVRAAGRTGAVADACGTVHQHGLAVDDAQRPFGTGRDTFPTSWPLLKGP